MAVNSDLRKPSVEVSELVLYLVTVVKEAHGIGNSYMMMMMMMILMMIMIMIVEAALQHLDEHDDMILDKTGAKEMRGMLSLCDERNTSM